MISCWDVLYCHYNSCLAETLLVWSHIWSPILVLSSHVVSFEVHGIGNDNIRYLQLSPHYFSMWTNLCVMYRVENRSGCQHVTTCSNDEVRILWQWGMVDLAMTIGYGGWYVDDYWSMDDMPMMLGYWWHVNGDEV